MFNCMVLTRNGVFIWQCNKFYPGKGSEYFHHGCGYLLGQRGQGSLVQLHGVATGRRCQAFSESKHSERARGHDVIVGVFSRWRWTVAHECIYAVAGVPLLQPNLEGFQSSSATLTSKYEDIIFVLDPRNEHVTSG